MLELEITYQSPEKSSSTHDTILEPLFPSNAAPSLLNL